MIDSRRLKYLGVYLEKDMEDFYSKHNKTRWEKLKKNR